MQTFTKEDVKNSNDCVHSNHRPSRRKISKLEQFLKKPYAGLFCCALGFSVILTGILLSNQSMYAIKLDNEEIAVLASKSDANRAMEQYAAATLGEGVEVSFSDKVKILPVQDREKEDAITVEQAVIALQENEAAIQVEGVAIVINGENKVFMANETLAQKAIGQAKQYYPHL